MAVTKDRFPYKTATVIDQSFLDDCQNNLTNDLELIVDIERPDGGFIRASDRNKYVGGDFYEALTNFPVISRTVGNWLSGTIEFSDLKIAISNVDGRFNSILPAGADYKSWIGNSVTVSIVLREVAASKIPIFAGFITPQGGVIRNTKSIIFQARDKFDSVNVSYPTETLKESDWPFLKNSLAGTLKPVIYGDWTTNLVNTADVPAIVVNSEDPNMNGETSFTNNVKLVVSSNDIKTFNTSGVYIVRDDVFWLVDSSDITLGTGNKTFEIAQATGNTLIDGSDYEFLESDVIAISIVGKDLGSYDGNIVEICRDLLITYGGVTGGDFDANWNTFRDKSTPAQSAIVNIPGRLWRKTAIPVVEEVLNLLEEIRLEAFVDRDLSFRLNSLHFEDFVVSPSYSVTNPDIERNSFRPKLDIRNNFNRAFGSFNFNPIIEGEALDTPFFRNDVAITDAKRSISKQIIFPHLVTESDASNQIIEIIRMASGYIEHIEYVSTWRALLLDIGDFVLMNVKIESVVFEDVPCLIREIGYDPIGLKLPIKVWSFQLLPFPGWVPTGGGVTGGFNATITEE
jgi:hypothetical protein